MTAQLSREQLDFIVRSPECYSELESMMARMLLAGIDCEPVAYFYPGDETEWQGVALAEELDDEQKARCIPLYAAPPAPVAVPDEMPPPDTSKMFITDSVVAIAKAQGWNACRAAMLNDRPVTGWIKCSERMPENDDAVLILTGYMQTAYWCADENEWYWGDDSWFPDQVTHWMPLPSAPEQEV